MKQRRFFLYLVVGVSAYLVEIGSLYFLKVVMGLPDLMAVAISFWIGFVIAFILQKWVTFKNHDKQPKAITKQIVTYSLLVLFNYLFTLGIVVLFSQAVSVFIVRTIAIAIITIWNYAIYRTVIFKVSDASKK